MALALGRAGGRPSARKEILRSGRLAGVAASELADRFGTPLFVYDLDVIDRQVATLRAALPDRVELAYAVKANPALAIVAHLGCLGLGAGVASGGELATAPPRRDRPGSIRPDRPRQAQGRARSRRSGRNRHCDGRLARACPLGVGGDHPRSAPRRGRRCREVRNGCCGPSRRSSSCRPAAPARPGARSMARSRPGRSRHDTLCVHLVGAGPGDPELITVRGRRLLERADAVVHDRLVGAGLLELIPAGTLRIDVGKTGYRHAVAQPQINATLIRLAHAGLDVVRLKGGDPFVFGRGGEEAEALRAAGIPFDVVPAVTAGVAGPAYAGILRPRDARAAGQRRCQRRGRSRQRGARYDDLGSVAAMFAAHADRIAAVIVEPVAANMGVVAPAPALPS